MPTPFFADLVREIAQEGGTGPLTPAGAVPGHRRFAEAVPLDTQFHYAIAGVARPEQWEVGLGHLDAGGRLIRDAVAASSNGDAAVDFSPGLKTLALTVAADWFEGVDAALAGKQPISTGHATVANGAGDDLITVRRGTGWANLPLDRLAYRDADGRHRLSGPLAAPGGSGTAPSISFAASPSTGIFCPSSEGVGIAISGAPRFSFSSPGLLTIMAAAGGYSGIVLSRDGGPSAAKVEWSFNHRDNNKDLLVYGYDGSTFKNCLFFDWSNGETLIGSAGYSIVAGATYVRPGTDNAIPLGQPANRWSVVYAGTGTINTSDATEKLWRGAADAAELRAARRIAGELGFFQWREAIAEKGADGARHHFGARAQAVWAIMADEGLVNPLDGATEPSSRYAFLCHDRWEKDGEPAERFGIRPDQLALFLIAAQEARLALLEGAV